MPENRILEWEEIAVELFPERTAAYYRTLPDRRESENPALRFFHRLLPRGSREFFAFLEELGVDSAKIASARPLCEPDESGEILYLASAPLQGRILRGGTERPRQSVEHLGGGLIFSQEGRPEGELELRFVVPLPFDAELLNRL